MKQDTRKTLIALAVVIAIVAVLPAKNLRRAETFATIAGEEVVGSGKPAMLELGSQTCLPCRKMVPVLEKFAKSYRDEVAVGFVDVDLETAMIEKYNVKAKPTQVFFDAEGEEIFRHVGFYPLEDILAKWKELGVEPAGRNDETAF